MPARETYQPIPEDQTHQPIPLDGQIKAVEREIAFRRRVYERRVHFGQMSLELAAREISAMRAVLATLKGVRDA